MLRSLVPRLSDALFIAILAGGMLLGPRMLNVDSDLGRHLTLGAYMLETRTVPSQDILSFTKSGAARPPYEWLSQIVFAVANRWLGLGGVVLVASVAIAAAFWVVLADSMERSLTPVLSLVATAWAAAASSVHWLTRPHVFSFVFFAVWIAALERLRKGWRMPIWLFPCIMLVWANAHGGFVLAFLAWAAYAVGWLTDARARAASKAVGIQLFVAGAASLVASVITPDLWHNWDAVLRNRSPFILSHTTETMPPNLQSPSVWPYLAILGLCLVGMVRRRRKLVPAHGFLLFSFGVLSLAMARNIPFFAIAATPILVEWGSEILRQRARWADLETAIWKISSGLRGQVWPAIFVAAAIGWLALKPLPSQVAAYRFNPDVFPVGAADWARAHALEGHIFNDFNWGGYLLYRLWPQQRVFIDSQSDFYGEALTRDYEQMIDAGSGWQALLDRYDIQWVVVPPYSGLSQKLEVNDGWSLFYSDPTADVFRRGVNP